VGGGIAEIGKEISSDGEAVEIARDEQAAGDEIGGDDDAARGDELEICGLEPAFVHRDGDEVSIHDSPECAPAAAARGSVPQKA
jgi:hypothetical protein